MNKQSEYIVEEKIDFFQQWEESTLKKNNKKVLHDFFSKPERVVPQRKHKKIAETELVKRRRTEIQASRDLIFGMLEKKLKTPVVNGVHEKRREELLYGKEVLQSI